MLRGEAPPAQVFHACTGCYPFPSLSTCLQPTPEPVHTLRRVPGRLTLLVPWSYSTSRFITLGLCGSTGGTVSVTQVKFFGGAKISSSVFIRCCLLTFSTFVLRSVSSSQAPLSAD